MADKKLTEVDASTTLADNDKLFGNISNAVKQITLTDLVTIIKNKISSLKNPNKLKFTGAVTNEYDGSKEVTINIPENSGESYTLPVATSTTLGGVKPVSKTSEMSQDVGVDSNGKLYTKPGSGGSSEVEANIPRQEMTSSNTTVTLQPNILYVFPEMAYLTVTLATPTDDTIANEYHFFFTSGATPTSLTLNDVLSDTYSIEANTKYEVSILEGVAYIRGVANSA